MFYEGCTLYEIRAFRELESESFDFGEGEMKIEGWYGSEDAYYEMCLPEESGIESEPFNDSKEKSKLKIRANKYYINQLHKKKLDELYKINWWAVSDMGTHKKRCYLSNRRKVAKRQSNKRVRQYKGTFNKGSHYRKMYEYWYSIL